MLPRRRISFVLLIMLGNIVTVKASPGVDFTAGQKLDCTNDWDTLMTCELEAQNCTGYNLTITSNEGYGETSCVFKQWGRGRCRCSTEMVLVLGEAHTATVWRGRENMTSKIIRITYSSFKPRVPTIKSVKESNGNFQIMWRTNMEEGRTNDKLYAEVTYRKKGHTKKVSKSEKPTTVNGLKFSEILGDDLEPSTSYLVSVKTYLKGSGHYSDSSEELEFTSPPPRDNLLLALIVPLSIAAVVFSCVLYGCYVKVKAKWWDPFVSCPNPKLLNMCPSEPEVLKPIMPIISSISVEPLLSEESKPWLKESMGHNTSGSSQHSSGSRTHSSGLSYAVTETVDIIAEVQGALRKALANISPVSLLTTNPHIEPNTDRGLLSSPANLCAVRAAQTTSGFRGFENKTYSILIPCIPHQSAPSSSEVRTRAEMLCDSAYHPSNGDTYQPAPACPLVNLPPVVLSPMPTDMSYQQCNADPCRFSNTEDSSLSPMSRNANQMASCDSVSGVEAGCENSDKAVGGAERLSAKIKAATWDENPCYDRAPAGSGCFPSVDDDYQPFQNVAQPPDVFFSETGRHEEETALNKCPERSVGQMPQATFNPLLPGSTNNQCLSEPQRPFPFLMSANQSMPAITDSDYQSV